MKRILFFIVAVSCVTVGLVLLSVLWLRGDGGRAWLAREIAALVGTPGEAEISIGTLTGDPFGAFRMSDIRVRDRSGDWLTIGSIAITWRPLDLLQAAVTVTRAEVRAATFMRLPEPDPSTSPPNFTDRVAAFRRLPSIRIAAFEVDNLALGELVSGEAAVLRIAGGMETAPAEEIRGRIAITRVDGRAGSLDAEGKYLFANDTLTLDVVASEPAGGLLARALNVPGLAAFQMTGKGAGTLADWRGRAAFSFERVASGEADITVHRNSTKREVHFDVAGTATVPAGDGNLLRRVVSGGHRFRVAGTFGPDAVLSVTDARWSMPRAEVTASGRIGLDDLALGAKATLRKTDEQPLRLTPGGTGVRALIVDMTASGRLPLPALRMTVDAGSFDLPGVATMDITAAMSMTAIHEGRGRIEGSATLSSIDWRDRPSLSALAGNRAMVDLSADLDQAEATVRVERVRVALAHAELTGSGRFGWKDGVGDAKAALDLPDLSVLRRFAALPVAGHLTASLDAVLRDFGATASGKLGGSVEDFTSGDAVADAALGRTLSFSAALERAGDRIAAKQMNATAGRTRLRADASYDIAQDDVAGNYALDIAAGPAWALADGVAIDCTCRLAGTLRGKAAEPGTTGDLSAEALRIKDVALRALKADYTLTRLTGKPAGDIAAKAETPLGPATLRTGVTMHADRLALSGLQVESGGATARGTLDIPLSGAPVTGDLKFGANALDTLLAATGLEGEGKATGRMALRAAGKRQALDTTATVTALRFRSASGGPVLSAETATIGLVADDLFAGNGGKVDVTLERASIGDAAFKRMTAAARGGVAKARLTLQGTGTWRGPLAIEAVADYTAEKTGQALTFSMLQATLLDERLSLGKPMRIVWEGTERAVSPIDVAFGGGRLNGHVRVGDKVGDVSLALAGLPLKLIDPFWPLGLDGKIDATVMLKGPWPAPDGEVTLSVQRIRVDRASDSPMLAVTVEGTLRRGRLSLDGRITAGDAAPSIFNASLPLRLDGARFYAEVPRDQPVSAHMAWAGDAATLWRFVPLSEHLLRGTGKIDMTLSGTGAKPDLRGTMLLSNGYYESLEYGTVLKPLDLAIAFDGARAHITQLSAGDGSGGRIDGKGAISFDADAGFPFDLALTLKALTAVRRDDIQVSASGSVSVGGSMKKAMITSKLTTDLVEVRVIDRLPPEVATLDVVEIGRLGQARTRTKPARPITADIGLAIEVVMPHRVFVRGRGIDSEWKGNLKVTGPASAPRIGGNLTLVRGQLSVVGKSFKMESGNIVLPDRANADPELSLTATYAGSGLTVTALVSGPVSKPVIKVSSSPPLPQDEIVSRVLFDKSTSKLSPYEAAQLGFAIAELSGKGGAGSVMDFARKTLGVDVLQVQSVDTAKGSQPVVGAGKYVTEDVYVGVKQGATPETSSVGVAVEVTPNIIVESDVRRDGQSDVGVKFKLDY